MTSSAFQCGVSAKRSIILLLLGTIVLPHLGKESMCAAFSVGSLLSSDADAPYPIIIGEPLRLKCDPPNIEQDKSKVEWIKDGEYDNILVSDNQYSVDSDNRTLLIISAEPEDAGTYECRTTSAQPLIKQFSAFFFKLEDLPEKTCAAQGGNITLTCLAEGRPIPTVQWLKDGQKLNDSKYDYKSNTHYISNAVLSIVNVLGSDAGTYTCQVFSDIGVENTTTAVNVEGSCSTGLGGGEYAGIFIGICLIVALASTIFCYITKQGCFKT